MKKLILLSFILIIIISCEKQKKTYYSIKIVKDTFGGRTLVEERLDTIFEDNDSLALINNYTSYIVSIEMEKKFRNRKKSTTETIDYKLLDVNNKVIITTLTNEVKNKIVEQVKKSMKSSAASSSNTYSYQNSDNVCITSEYFIKKDLLYPYSADFSIFDCSVFKNSDGSYSIVRKISAKNAFGVESSFIYKVKLGFKGGEWADIKNWDMISIQSEEYN